MHCPCRRRSLWTVTLHHYAALLALWLSGSRFSDALLVTHLSRTEPRTLARVAGLGFLSSPVRCGFVGVGEVPPRPAQEACVVPRPPVPARPRRSGRFEPLFAPRLTRARVARAAAAARVLLLSRRARPPLRGHSAALFGRVEPLLGSVSSLCVSREPPPRPNAAAVHVLLSSLRARPSLRGHSASFGCLPTLLRACALGSSAGCR